MLLSETSLSALPGSRLPDLLRKSREAQAEVSTRLSQQVLAALYQLMQGFVAADARKGDGELAELAREEPQELYSGLITALMRLVFILYAEDRGLMSDHPVYQQNYSLGGLYARLRDDAAAWPDTMDQRFGAWAQLLSLFRLIYGGGGHNELTFVARKGRLFDPDRFPFLEGRTEDGEVDIPLIPDSTVWNVLNNLMVLDGERLSYRTLDVEQIGSVYESIMGFTVELTSGRSVAVRSPKRTGAAVIVDLDKLLATAAGQRVNALKAKTDRNLTGNAATMLREASTPEEIVQALDRNVDRDATPNILPANTPVLQPTDERRRTGSHYTPRSLTEPIVTEALRPFFDRLGASPAPEAILDIKVLDPATGSGAFLVEACRQLAEKLVDAWSAHGAPTDIPPDEDQLLYAKRLVAQRCLYGVDKNSMAIDLARLSLWLATLSRDHEFTFVDHSLRHGDSLVGLTRQQIEGFHWKADAPVFQPGVEAIQMRERLAKVNRLRQKIRHKGHELAEQELLALLDDVESELHDIRSTGDVVLTAFFKETTKTARERTRRAYAQLLAEGSGDSTKLLEDEVQLDVDTFHWGIEFPEVFDRENPGFDAIVGNPPFQGGRNLSAAQGDAYVKWLVEVHQGSSGGADLVAHFFRRSFGLLRDGGSSGLIATNTIGQGDTRSSGLRWVCKNGGTIYRAQRRVQWPGEAAVVVSVVHLFKGNWCEQKYLDGKAVDTITAFLFNDGAHDDPIRLLSNSAKSFVGSYVLGMGFTFDDSDSNGVATPISVLDELLEKDSDNQQVVFPYIGGEEVNTSPRHSPHRYIIDFEERDEEYCRNRWPDLFAIVERNVKPERINKDAQKYPRMVLEWWKYWNPRVELRSAIEDLDRVLAISRVGQHGAFTFIPTGSVYAETLIIFPYETHAALCTLQSRPHEIWVRFFASTLEERLRYTPSDCFGTFPFPENWSDLVDLEAAGEEYYRFRADLMVRNNEGMTKTYNRFHDPDERNSDILRLRELHANMDRVMLDAYGWADVPTDCEFLLDFEIDEEEYRRRKKPWRYRWPDEVRDDVLARLLALNGERAQLERIMAEQAAQAANIELLKV
ncbi:MAG: N-6 DNA methylase [Chloroflexi bacterium]|nr:N-6 DNA methylase [Chloroflexota bacterium]